MSDDGSLLSAADDDGAVADVEVDRVLRQLSQRLSSSPGGRMTVVVPDTTRTVPLARLLGTLVPLLEQQGFDVTLLVALGTHRPVPPADLDTHLGMSASARSAAWPRTRVVQHAWEDPAALGLLGVLPSSLLSGLTSGLVTEDLPVTLNRHVLDADVVLLVGPVFPHEVAGFSGGAKYLLPGVAGPEAIDATHWLGALWTNLSTIGTQDTPVRRVLHAAADLLPRPPLAVCCVLRGSTLHGLHAGRHDLAWRAAAEQAGRLDVVLLPRRVERVLAEPARRYPDMWTAAKAIYKTEPVVADGGEVVILAPHVSSLSEVHGALLDQVGYHVRDWFLEHWDRYAHVPGAVLAHSTHVRGAGTVADGVERPRMRVTLATSVPSGLCERVGLGWADWRTQHPQDFDLHVPEAGEVLYRAPG